MISGDTEGHLVERPAIQLSLFRCGVKDAARRREHGLRRDAAATIVVSVVRWPRQLDEVFGSPAFAGFGVDELGGFGISGDLHGVGVPLDGLAGADGQRA